MKQFAVLYVAQDSLTGKWDIVFAENARRNAVQQAERKAAKQKD